MRESYWNVHKTWMKCKREHHSVFLLTELLLLGISSKLLSIRVCITEHQKEGIE